MQARVDVGLPPGLSEELVALLDAVRDTTGMHFPEPDMPMMDAIRVHQAMRALAKVAHLARDVAAIRPPRTGRNRRPSEATRPVEAEAIPELEIVATSPVAPRDDNDSPGWQPPDPAKMTDDERQAALTEMRTQATTALFDTKHPLHREALRTLREILPGVVVPETWTDGCAYLAA